MCDLDDSSSSNENEEIEAPSEDSEFEDSELEDYDIEHTVTRCGHLLLSGSSEDIVLFVNILNIN